VEFFFLIFFTVEIYLSLKLARKFDPVFPNYVHEKSALENGWWILSPLMRGLRYAGCILFKSASKKRGYCNYFFKGYDFRSHATSFELFLIWVMLISISLIVIFGSIMYLINQGKYFI